MMANEPTNTEITLFLIKERDSFQTVMRSGLRQPGLKPRGGNR
jgi:hypothetical protein